MTKKPESEITIASDTVLLDIVSRWPATETVFHRYNEKAGVCLCCTCLFDTIEDVASRFSLDLKAFLHDIEKAAAG
ncbi:MAG TPA: hypothetical protein DDZ34_06355 [Syntrophaceae bacterium]|jgi:hypothetical protein|nr:hypothetical protein [Syntrophaceae bacterium]